MLLFFLLWKQEGLELTIMLELWRILWDLSTIQRKPIQYVYCSCFFLYFSNIFWKYYSLPFCSGTGRQRRHKQDLGETLSGSRKVATPYDLTFLDPVPWRSLCEEYLDAADVSFDTSCFLSWQVFAICLDQRVEGCDWSWLFLWNVDRWSSNVGLFGRGRYFSSLARWLLRPCFLVGGSWGVLAWQVHSGRSRILVSSPALQYRL